MSAARRIGILAGGGTLPREIADAVAARAMPVHIVAIDGEANADFGPYPVTRVNWGGIGRMVSTFKQTGCTDLIIIGSVTRPDLATIKPDLGFARALGTVLRLVLAGGDDSVLRGVIAFFERQGFRVVSAAQLAPELVIGEGHFVSGAGGPSLLEDARIGFDMIAALGRFDIGQAAVVSDGRLEALEGAEGTDRMLERIAVQRRKQGSSNSTHSGVLVKRTKPAQDARIDLPVIGPQTVALALDCGLVGIAVEAGHVLAAERGEMVARAQDSGLSIIGIGLAGGGGGDSLPYTRSSLSGSLLRTIKARRAARTIAMRPLGHHKIPLSLFPDAKRGLDVMAALEPISRTRAVVVVRAHVLAVETGEGVTSALGRAVGLRQWGDRRLRRRAGVAVIDAGRDCTPELIGLLEQGHFAGMVVKLRRFTAGVPADTISAADKAGVFVAGLAVDGESGHG
ncbi:MAG TPA: UDP-2,3-diacylglucosamine diphosphatase LpxI [Hyphomicrobiaceae bacterium]|nr:UDP-2,3-diacylglucosamine diphosphatase LpxI [Hyphomicrobiaceae bacterium]